MTPELQQALDNPLFQSHKPEHRYKMDGKGSWQLYYYPIFGCGETGQQYGEPRALMRTIRTYKGGKVGQDLREVPLRYIERIT